MIIHYIIELNFVTRWKDRVPIPELHKVKVQRIKGQMFKILHCYFSSQKHERKKGVSLS
jgi:hypothetical protein